MPVAQVVIGGNFGDEGKGLVTDFLAAQHGPGALVVRFNGGGQAGHTVTAPDGRRHVFNHLGSGSFVGAPTYLSRFFVSNPCIFLKELPRAQAAGMKPVVFVDPLSPVTTPYDMMINQMMEELRGQGRHGSCGAGFGETLERQQHARFRLCFGDLAFRDHLMHRLRLIRDEWVCLSTGSAQSQGRAGDMAQAV